MRHAAAQMWQLKVLKVIHVSYTAGIIKRLQDLWCGSQQGTWRVRCSTSHFWLMQHDHGARQQAQQPRYCQQLQQLLVA
jgi:hypothetical protein